MTDLTDIDRLWAELDAAVAEENDARLKVEQAQQALNEALANA